MISANARLEVFERFAERAAQAPYVVNYERWPWPWKFAVGDVDGEPVVLILKRGEDARTPYSAIRFDVIGQRIDRILDYIHCPRVIEAATTVTIAKLSQNRSDTLSGRRAFSPGRISGIFVISAKVCESYAPIVKAEREITVHRFVRVTAPGSMAFATLLLVTAPAVMAAAVEQDGPPTEASTATGQTPAPPAGPRGRPFVNVLGAIPLVIYAAASGPRDSEVLTPADRFAMSQLIGVGYVVNPRFRFGVMGIFNEVLTGLPPTAPAWQFGGVAPVAIGTFERVIIGGGPIIGYRSGGKRQSDVGAVVLSGASIPLRKGLALNIVAPTTALFVRRVTVSVGIAVGVAKVF